MCIISYINFRRFPELLTRNPREAVSLRDICQKLTQEDEQLGLSQLSYIPVAQQAAQTERFAGTRMFAFEDRSDQETQFAAVTFLLPDKSVFVAFRGTDTSLVGWKEDFNMSYLESVPAQVRAAEYTAEIMRLCRFHKVRIGGLPSSTPALTVIASLCPTRITADCWRCIITTDPASTAA